MSIRYAPGPAFALVRPGLVILVDASVGAAVAADLWAAVVDVDAAVDAGTAGAVAGDAAVAGPAGQPGGRGLATLLDAVTEVLDPTWRALPSFAIALIDSHAHADADAGRWAAQVAVRGTFSAAVTTHKTTEHVSGPDVTTWVDTTIDGVVHVELTAGASDGSDAAPALLTIRDGIVLVDRVRWDVRDGADVHDAANEQAGTESRDAVELPEAAAGTQVEAEERAEAVSETASGPASDGDDDAAVADEAGASASSEIRTEDEAAALDHGLSPVQLAESDFARTLASFPEEWEDEAAEPGTADDDEFDDTTLFATALTQIRNSIPAGAPHGAPEVSPPSAMSAPPAMSALPAAPALPVTTRSAVSTGAVLPPPPPPPPAGDVASTLAPHQHGSHQQGSPHQGPRPVESFRDPAPRGTEILARSCFFGHPNPPARMTCAQCGGGLNPNAHLVERPSLGRVEVSTGESLDLSVPIVVGRFPQAQTTGSPIAQRLVAVPSPSQDISRSHLEIRLDGWHVLLVDLDTVNGTTLLRTGQAPRRLHPQEPTLVADGDVVDLGDGVTLTFHDLI